MRLSFAFSAKEKRKGCEGDLSEVISCDGASSDLPTTRSELNTRLSLRPSPRLPDNDRGAHGFDGCEEQVLCKSGRPAPSGQSRNEGQKTVYQGHNATREDIRQPVRSELMQPARHDHGDGYFHQDR